MSKQVEPELKECPFCAMVPRLITIPGFEPRSYVMCSLGCGACGPEINGKDASDRAVAAWNTRVPVDSVAPGVDQQDNEEIRLALEGMIAAFDVSNYGDASIVATTRECALSIAKRAVGWTFASPAPKEEDEGLIALLLNWRKWYNEDLFSPWTIEEAQRVHEQFPGAVDRISADSVRGTIDNIIEDIRAGKHRASQVSDGDPDD